jgi:hypothetical protein
LTAKVKTAVVVSDTHVPYQDEPSLNVIESITKDLNPEQVIHLGDLLDCYTISRFLKDPTRMEGLQEEIDEAKKVLERFNRVAPRAKKTLLEGNHEARLSKTIASMDGPARELARLESFQEAMKWPSLLNIQKYKWGWVGENKQPTTELIPNMLFKHGTVVRKFSGYTARGEWENYGMNGASGHTHRLSVYHHSTIRGSSFWVETGCTCSLKPEYMVFPNWMNGFVVISYDHTGPLSVESVQIQNGSTVFRGNVYKG